jgi:O-antigen/teichoic acid export membrane protein
VLSAAIILLLPGSPHVTTALVITACIAALNIAILFAVYRRVAGLPVMRIDMKTARLLLGEGAPLAVSALGIALYTYAGPTVLKYTRGESELGLFSAGYKLVTILTIIPTAFTQVLFPVFSEFFAHAREKLEKSLADSLRVITLISIPLAAGALVVGNDLFRLLYPVEYLPGVIVMQVTLLGSVLGYMDWVLYSFLLANNRQAFLMWLLLGAGAGAAVASILLVPRFGYVALPFMISAVEAILFVSQIAFVRHLGYRRLWLRSFWRPAAAALVMAATLLLMGSFPLPVRITVGALVYGGALYAVKGLGEQERAILRGFITRISPGRS